MPKHLESDHPTLKQLRAFANGKVNGNQDTWIEDHVLLCQVCAKNLEDVPADLLIALLRGQVDAQHLSHAEQTNIGIPSFSIQVRSEARRTSASFEIQQQLGRGGMGVVYLAWQPALSRHIALKMIARGDLANPEDLQRFHREAAAAASLRHENIAQVYDVGEQDGRPYIAMELVRGCTLSQYLSRGPMPVDAAVRLFIKLADAVQHAHSHSVIHRDLKPSNVLLDGCDLSESGTPAELRPKIVDFGLAKRVDQIDSQTLTGDLIGTPSYMSPEQAKGNTQAIGVGADIYALGAILYEVLVGRPPFQGASPLETIEQVLSQDPVRPTRLRPGLPKDLETICLKCLEKSPSRRYEQASMLLNDLKRFQSGLTITARPASWSTQIAKWTKRRPALAALLGSIAIGVAGILTLGISHNRSMRKALEETREEKTRADTNFRFAIRSIEQMLERVGFEQLKDRPEMEEVRAELLKDAVMFYADLLATQPESELESRRLYSRALARQGNIQWMLGKKEEGRASLQRAIELQTQLWKELPEDPEVQHELAICYVNYGLIDHGAESFRSAIKLLEPIQSTYPASLRELAQARSNLATATALSDEAESLHLSALKLRQELLKETPDDQRLQFGVGQSQYNLAFLYLRTGRHEIASDAFTKALVLFEKLVEQHGTVTEYQSSLAECYTSLATLRNQTGDFAAANELIAKGTDTRRLLVDRYPKIPSLRNSLARGYLTHVSFLIQRNQFTEAVALSEKAVDIAEQLNQEIALREHRLLVAASLTILATAASGLPDKVAAKNAFERATRMHDVLLAETPNDVSCLAEAGVNCMNFSNVLRLDDPIRALHYNDRSVELLERI
jgi:eukaryotic-like serine/threonine-protein kinase